MIKILKFENIYGIKQLVGANNLKKNSVIYAPNGTAKSSIADALEIIGNTNNPSSFVRDFFGNLPAPSFEIDVDGNICTETNRIPFKVIKYSGISDFEIINNNGLANIVMSQNILNQISANLAKIDNSKQIIKSLIDGQFPQKGGTEGFKDTLATLAETRIDDPDLYLKLINNLDLTATPLSLNVNEKMVLDIINEKSKTACTNPSVVSVVQEYFNIINNNIISTGRPSFFDDDFTLEKLQDFHNNAIKNKYYKDNPNRKLQLEDTTYGKDDIDNLIENEINRVYGTNEAKKQFDEIVKSFKGRKVLVDTFKLNPNLLSELNDYKSFSNKLFITMISPVINQITAELIKIKNAQIAISNIRNSCSPNDNEITKIWEQFKSRFKFKKFDLKIDNEFNAVIGKEVPIFAKYVIGTNQRITNPKEMRFSTGEIKTINLINFIITVESMISSNNKFIIVLDDAVDSFDYKNKYGIIDYLVSIKDNPNIQLLILTHNFDFYRSSIISFGSRTTIGQYFAYRNQNNEVEFYDTTSNRYLLQMADFNSWKNSPSIEKYYALIPFSRNVLQLSANSQNNLVQSIDSFIHYDTTSEAKTLADVDNILNPFMLINKPFGIVGTEKYLYTMNNAVGNIINGNRIVRETDLEYKILLGLYIRVFLERYLFLKYRDYTGRDPVINSNYNRTYDLINLNRPNLDSSELKFIIEANIVSPSYVHINSFMYEPLIDVGCDELIEIAKWINNQNQTWPL